ncbi:MAG: GatB/YqeY domain-containing protein [Deltaproteobacteria bacterium]|nr:GatB/YqeY domain-containing protein [Deltaproteobacteria bacterium]
MSIKETVLSDLKAATKSQEKLRLSTIRLLVAAMKNREIELRRALDDVGVLALIGSMVQQRRQAIELYQQGKRQDLADKEQKEIEILQGYLPSPLTSQELEKLVQEAITQTGATSERDMGKVMKTIMPQVTGRADGKEVSALVVKCLKGKT